MTRIVIVGGWRPRLARRRRRRRAADDVQAGKAKSGACAVCHGAQGQGVGANVALAGKSEAEIVQALPDFKSGKRAATVMKPLAGMLSDQDMANFAASRLAQVTRPGRHRGRRTQGKSSAERGRACASRDMAAQNQWFRA